MSFESRNLLNFIGLIMKFHNHGYANLSITICSKISLFTFTFVTIQVVNADTIDTRVLKTLVDVNITIWACGARFAFALVSVA